MATPRPWPSARQRGAHRGAVRGGCGAKRKVENQEGSRCRRALPAGIPRPGRVSLSLSLPRGRPTGTSPGNEKRPPGPCRRVTPSRRPERLLLPALDDPIPSKPPGRCRRPQPHSPRGCRRRAGRGGPEAVPARFRRDSRGGARPEAAIFAVATRCRHR